MDNGIVRSANKYSSGYNKSYLPTYNELYNEIYKNNISDDIDLYWGIPTRQVLLGMFVNYANMMIESDSVIRSNAIAVLDKYKFVHDGAFNITIGNGIDMPYHNQYIILRHGWVDPFDSLFIGNNIDMHTISDETLYVSSNSKYGKFSMILEDNMYNELLNVILTNVIKYYCEWGDSYV